MIGERLRAARKMRGMSQRALAQRAGVSAMAISKYERNLMMPGSETLLRLAQALNVRLEFFLRPLRVQVTTPAFRKRHRLPKKAQQAIQARVQEWVERYLQVEALFPDCAQPFVLPKGWPRQVRSEDDIEHAAEAWRDVWHLGRTPIANMVALFEARGIKVGVLDETHDAFDALTLEANGSPVIVVRRNIPGDRQRFNLAHELAHLVLEVDRAVDEEKAAHRFAAAFLAPRQAVITELGAHRVHLAPAELAWLKHKYGLSMQAWILRARDVGVLTPSAAQSLLREFRRQGWHRREPGAPYPFEEPKRMLRLIWRALAEGLISPARAAELYGKPLEGWQLSLEQAPHGLETASMRY